MMADDKKNSLIDNDFISDGDEGAKDQKNVVEKEDKEEGRFFFDDTGAADKVSGFPDAKEVGKDGEEKPEIVVEVTDDTPAKDKGKWVASEKDGEPEFPNKDEVEQYSADVQKRIAKLTAQTHAHRRASDDKGRQLEEATKLAKRLIAENNQLKEVVEGGEKVLMGEHKARLDAMLDKAKAAYREAAEAGDTNGVIAAQEQMAKAIAQQERLSAHRPQVLPREDEKVSFPEVEQKVQPSERATDWQERNPWFGQDGYEPMTSMALGIHQRIIAEGDIKPESEEYFSRIDKEIRQRFPERFRPSNGGGGGQNDQRPQSQAPSQEKEKEKAPQRKQNIVGSATRQTGNGSRKVVQLTESQVRLARKLGLTTQQYAEQVAAEDSGDGKTFTF